MIKVSRLIELLQQTPKVQEKKRMHKNENALNCECNNWARTKGFLTVHHPNCKEYDPEGDAVVIITKLVRGIEAWAGDEDGVHPECWGAYTKAKFIIGEYVTEWENE